MSHKTIVVFDMGDAADVIEVCDGTPAELAEISESYDEYCRELEDEFAAERMRFEQALGLDLQ